MHLDQITLDHWAQTAIAARVSQSSYLTFQVSQ